MKLTKEDLDILNSNLNPHDVGYCKAVIEELDFLNSILISRFTKEDRVTRIVIKSRKKDIEEFLMKTLAIAKDRKQRKLNQLYRDLAKIRYF